MNLNLTSKLTLALARDNARTSMQQDDGIYLLSAEVSRLRRDVPQRCKKQRQGEGRHCLPIQPTRNQRRWASALQDSLVLNRTGEEGNGRANKSKANDRDGVSTEVARAGGDHHAHS